MAITQKAARVNAGLSQTEAARLLGISKNTLSSYENYKTIPDIEMAKRIAKLYQCTVDDLIFFNH